MAGGFLFGLGHWKLMNLNESKKENAKMHLRMVFCNFCAVHITVKVNHFHVFQMLEKNEKS